jgi:hypothetical protein
MSEPVEPQVTETTTPTNEQPIQPVVEQPKIDEMTDEELSKVVYTLEEKYPHFSRLPEWKLLGFVDKTSVPIWYSTGYDKSRYNGEKQRELRSIRGVGAKERKAFKRAQNAAMDEMVATNQANGDYN